MFQAGTFVVYGNKGIYKIIDTTTLDIEGIPRDKLYYVLQAFDKPQSSVYAQVDTASAQMRQIMSKKQAQIFLSAIDKIEPLDIRNDKKREDAIKECIRSCDPDELMRVIKTLYSRKLKRLEQGKKLTLSDSHFMQQAEGILYEELSLSLDIPKENMSEYIQAFLKKS